jgi:hypothetical protein
MYRGTFGPTLRKVRALSRILRSPFKRPDNSGDKSASTKDFKIRFAVCVIPIRREIIHDWGEIEGLKDKIEGPKIYRGPGQEIHR